MGYELHSVACMSEQSWNLVNCDSASIFVSKSVCSSSVHSASNYEDLIHNWHSSDYWDSATNVHNKMILHSFPTKAEETHPLSLKTKTWAT